MSYWEIIAPTFKKNQAPFFMFGVVFVLVLRGIKSNKSFHVLKLLETPIYIFSNIAAS